jgi:cytochrome c oxidase subunit 4
MAHGEHHISSTKTNLVIFGLLVIATGLTVWAPSWELGSPFGPLVAFSIATFKAYLVLAYFMHLKYDVRSNTLIFFSSFIFLAILAAYVLLDVFTRVAEVSPL